MCGLVFMLLIGTLIGAIILRAACWLLNKLAGGPNAPGAVPEPSFGKAMGIAFVTALVNAMVGFVLGLVGGAAALHPLVVQAISFPVALLVMAGMAAAMLPTTFGKGLLVALLTLVVWVIVAVVIAIVVMIVLVPLGLLGGFGR